LAIVVARMVGISTRRVSHDAAIRMQPEPAGAETERG
jgi:hypothetical protein